jgi:hypothetical protein
MSMNFTSNISSGKPMIRETANMANDGGGGNLGYMMQGDNRNRGSKKDESIFESDLFKKTALPPSKNTFTFVSFIAQIIVSIKRILGIAPKVQPLNKPKFGIVQHQ